MAERKLCLRCGQSGHTSSGCKRRLMDSPTNSAIFSSRLTKVLKALSDARPKGMRAAELRAAVLCEMSETGVHGWLQKRRQAGHLAMARAGNVCIWCAPEDQAEVLIRAESEAKASAEAAARATVEGNRARREANAKKAVDTVEAWAAKPFDRVVVPASAAKPLRGIGPCSVFDLAARMAS